MDCWVGIGCKKIFFVCNFTKFFIVYYLIRNINNFSRNFFIIRYKQQTSVPATNAIVMNGIHHSPNKGSPKQDWTEMQDMPSPQSGKKAAYQRAGSKDSMEVRVHTLISFG